MPGADTALLIDILYLMPILGYEVDWVGFARVVQDPLTMIPSLQSGSFTAHGLAFGADAC